MLQLLQTTQPFEWIAVGLFLLGFIIGTFELFANPKKYKEKEIRFFQNHKTIGTLDKTLFALAAASFAFLIIHFIVESININQIFSYIMIIMYAITFPLFFLSDTYAQKMLAKAKKMSEKEYLAAGIARIILIGIMIVMPILRLFS